MTELARCSIYWISSHTAIAIDLSLLDYCSRRSAFRIFASGTLSAGSSNWSSAHSSGSDLKRVTWSACASGYH